MICGHIWQKAFVDPMTLKDDLTDPVPLVNVIIILRPTKMRIDMSSRIIVGQKLLFVLLLMPF